mmetsp:Transcript_73752/g.173058  ORF Transcript_73752/g.173058 Transcript_73752/m.173058 type:complete len:553 (+) Transcript_73752:78-1736(+)
MVMGCTKAALLVILPLGAQGHCEHVAVLAWSFLDSGLVCADRALQHSLDIDHLDDEVTTSQPAQDQDPDAAEDNPELDPAQDTSHEKKSPRSRFKEFRDHQIATGLSIMFLGMVFLVGFVAWMIAYPDKQVKHYCVRICSSTVVIFMAIAIDHAAIFFTIVDAITGLKGWKLAVAPFFLYWMLTIFVSYLVRKQPLNMAAARNVISHVSAFVAITGFSDILYKFSSGQDFPKQQAIPCRAGVWLAICIGFWSLRQLSSALLHRLPYGCELPAEGHDGHAAAQAAEGAGQTKTAGHGHHEDGSGEDTPESVHLFIEEVEEALEEASLVALSYLFVKFLVTKTLLEVWDLKHLQNTYEARETHWTLSNDTVIEVLLIMALEVLFLNVCIIFLDRVSSGLHRFHTLSTFLSMCMAWSSMRFVRCMIMIPISEDNCILILTAFAMTPMAGLLVIAADRMADTGVISEPLADSLVTSYGFMIGFSWEKAFASASNLLIGEYVEGGSSTVRPHGPYEFWTGIAVCAALVIVMLPGWRFLILPNALQPLPPRVELGKDC